MNIRGKIENMSRDKDILVLFAKYGRSDLVKQSGMGDILAEEQEMSREESAKAGEFAADKNWEASFIAH
jgi:hypothetical protein